MDDKKTAMISMLSKAFLDLCEGYCEEHGGTLVNPRVVVVDAESADSGRGAVTES